MVVKYDAKSRPDPDPGRKLAEKIAELERLAGEILPPGDRTRADRVFGALRGLLTAEPGAGQPPAEPPPGDRAGGGLVAEFLAERPEHDPRAWGVAGETGESLDEDGLRSLTRWLVVCRGIDPEYARFVYGEMRRFFGDGEPVEPPV